MKRKFSKLLGVGLALALALSLVVMAAPVVADSPADTDVGYTLSKSSDGTATWADNSGLVTGLPAGGLGNYSVELISVTGTGDLHVELIPAAGITVSDLDDATGGDFGFWYYVEQTDGDGPNLELKFEDPDSTDYADITLMLQSLVVEDAWTEANLDTTFKNVGVWAGLDIGDPNQTLQQAIDALIAACEGSADWELTTVQAESFTANNAITYVDDITIAGVTYELEPIFLDAEYYSVGDPVEVTVPNFAANTDSIRINPVTGEPATDDPANWSITATSGSDPSGITVDIEETGANTGVFTGSFATTDTTPAGEDELYVQDGNTITVKYGVDPDFADWGAGDSATSIEASVDDTPPTITGLTPADGATEDTATPTIGASYSDPAGIDETSVEMLVDGVDVTDDATVNGSLSYTPTEEMVEGSHDVTVNVEDNAGNAATETWSFRIVSWLVEPMDGTAEDALDTAGVAVFDAGGASILVGRYASNPEPEATAPLDIIEDGFFDVQVTAAGGATEIVLIFADDSITAESTAYVWGDLEGAWLECSDQDYSVANEYLWVKVRDDTTPNIAELEGTPFAIGGEAAVSDISAYYKGYSGEAEVVETTDLLKAANDWAGAVVPSGFTEAISTTELLALANEWAAN